MKSHELVMGQQPEDKDLEVPELSTLTRFTVSTSRGR